VEDGEHHTGIQELDLGVGVEGDLGIKEVLEVHGVHFHHMVILEALGWGLMVVLDQGSKEAQDFPGEVGVEEEEDQCKETMSLGSRGRMKVLLGRRIWNRKVMGSRWEIIK